MSKEAEEFMRGRSGWPQRGAEFTSLAKRLDAYAKHYMKTRLEAEREMLRQPKDDLDMSTYLADEYKALGAVAVIDKLLNDLK